MSCMEPLNLAARQRPMRTDNLLEACKNFPEAEARKIHISDVALCPSCHVTSKQIAVPPEYYVSLP